MTVGVYNIEIHLPGAGSLKNKRQVLRRLKDRLRSRFNVALAETGEHADLWQRAELILVSVASNRDALEQLFESVHREAEQLVPGQIIEIGREFIDASESGPAAWMEEFSE
ncbi:MAG: DUF503 domain-containing protein [bacterium]|nr:DUF503 domain-containing protein [bacterium]